MGQGVLARYKALLPVTPNTPMITLGEGDTPLVRSTFLARETGCAELYFKLESCNPTGSFKDRGMVVAVAKAIEDGKHMLLCASTGNTSASAAAYGARCGLATVILVPKGVLARGKLAQAIACGACIITVKAGFDRALRLAKELSEKHPIALVNSINPNRLEGQKTAAFEIVEQMGDAPDYLFIPVGNAGNITAYWRGFSQYHELGQAAHRPKMMGFQAEGAAPIVLGHPVANPSTVASAIRIGNPAGWRGALAARDESGGTIDTVSDDQIMEAYRIMAQREGLFCEPASAAAVAGLLKLHRGGMHLKDKRVVCVITGTGLKDPDLAANIKPGPIPEVPDVLEEVEELLPRMELQQQPRESHV